MPAATPLRHRILAGPFAALEPRLFEAIDALKAGDPLAPVDVLVGGNLLALYLRRAYAERRGAHANLRFLTFLDLARELAPERDPRPALPALGPLQLARRALRETAEAELFGWLRGTASLAEALRATADDLRDAGVRPEELRGLLAELPATPDRRELLAAVASTIERLEALRGRFSDSASLMDRAAREAPPADAPLERLVDRGPLLVYGLHDIGGLRSDLLRRAALSRPVAAFVPDDGEEDDPELPAIRRGLFESLLGVEAERVEADEVPAAVVLAASDNDEARETVREALRAVEEGVPLHAIAILLRDPPRQEPAIAGELNRLGIPFFRPAGAGFARSPLGRAARLLVELSADGLSKGPLRELLDVLEGLTPTDGSTQASEPGAGAALAAAAASAVPDASPAPWAVWAERLSRSFDALFSRSAESAGFDRLAAAVEALGALESVEPETPQAPSDVLEVLPRALDASPTPHGQLERSGLALLPCAAARGLRFSAVVVPGLVERLFPSGGAADPFLTDDEREELRRRTGRPLAPRGGARHAREERFLFALARQAARERLVLVASRRDPADDRVRLVSPFLMGIIESKAGRSVGEVELEAPARAAALGVRRTELGKTARAGPHLDEEELFRAFDGERSLIPALGERAAAFDGAVRRGRARHGADFTEFEGRLPRGTPLFDLSKPLSASRLERFAACPYKSLFADALRLPVREEDEAELSPDALAMGGLVHAVLRDLAREASVDGRRMGALSPPDAERRVHRLAAQEVARWESSRARDLPEVFLEAARREVAAIALAVVAHERSRPGPLPFAGAEVRFGRRQQRSAVSDEDPRLSTDELVRVEVGGRELVFSGRLDRLDRDASRAHVVDYKVGKPAPYGKENRRRQLIAGGERLQLPVYALAARRMGAADVTSEYLFVERPHGRDEAEATGILFDAGETGDAVAQLTRFLALMAEAVAAGRFLPFTWGKRQPKPCDTCDFALVCGPGHVAAYERKWERLRRSAGGDPLLTMKELP